MKINNKVRKEILKELSIILKEGKATTEKSSEPNSYAPSNFKVPAPPEGGLNPSIPQMGGTLVGAGLGAAAGTAANVAMSSIAASSAVLGASSGAAAGSLVPVVGTIVGAAVGFGAGYLVSKLFTDKFTEVANDISEANIEPLPENNNLPKNFGEYIDLTTFTDNTTKSELKVFIDYAYKLVSIYANIQVKKDYEEFLRVLNYKDGNYRFKEQFDIICGNKRNIFLIDELGGDDRFYYCPCAYLQIYDPLTFKKVGEINVPAGLFDIGLQSKIEKGDNKYDHLSPGVKLESQPEITPPYIESIYVKSKEEDQKKEKQQKIESQLEALGNPAPGDVLEKSGVRFSIVSIDKTNGYITVKLPNSNKTQQFTNLQGFKLIKNQAQQPALQVGQKVIYTKDPSMGTYIISGVNPDKTINIKTLDGQDAGEKENAAEYQVVNESIKSKIIKEIGKLLKEAPKVKSRASDPAPATKPAPAPATKPAPAPATTSKTTTTSKDYTSDPRPLGPQQTDHSLPPDVAIGREAEFIHGEQQKQRVVGTFDGKVVRCADPKLIVILQQYLKYVKGYNQITVDGKYGGETHGYLRAAIGEKTPFKTVINNPSMVCKFILFPDGLTKKALGAGGTFDDLKDLIKSKKANILARKKSSTTGINSPSLIKVFAPNGMIGKKYPGQSKPELNIYAVTADEINKAAGMDYVNLMIKKGLTLYDVKDGILIKGNPSNISNVNPITKPGEPKDQLTKDDIDKKISMIQRFLSSTASLDFSEEEKKAYKDKIKDLETMKSKMNESWVIKNKGKYTQNLFERLIKDISKGN